MIEMEAKEYTKRIKAQFPLNKIKELIESLRNIKILVIGDTIVDEYHFTIPKGRAVKDPIMSVDYVNHEVYAGGVLAIANHISNFVENVSLVSLLGDTYSREDFIRKALNENINARFFVKKGSPTTVKRRFIDQIRDHKLFKVEYINDSPITKELENELLDYLKSELPRYDLVIVGDFGHGFINSSIARILEEYSKHLCLNVQTNSANYGFNLITRYTHANFTSMDETELKLTLMNRSEYTESLIKRLANKKLFDKILITLGSKGCVYTNNGEKLLKAPTLTESIVDTIGAGDAVFSIISLLTYVDAKDELIPFIANCVGGIAVNIRCNKESVTKEKLIRFVEERYNGVE